MAGMSWGLFLSWKETLFASNYCVFGKKGYLCSTLRDTGSVGRVARQRSAKPRTAVRICYRPQIKRVINLKFKLITLFILLNMGDFALYLHPALQTQINKEALTVQIHILLHHIEPAAFTPRNLTQNPQSFQFTDQGIGRSNGQ